MSRASEGRWRKSTRSAPQGDNCVEVTRDRQMLVRDSKNPNGPKLAFSAESWETFLGTVRAGRYDLLP